VVLELGNTSLDLVLHGSSVGRWLSHYKRCK
jgi:hypothetical protein